MNTPDPVWNRLTTAAKARLHQPSEPDRSPEIAPLGFSTRVVALWREAREADRRLALWQRISWRAAFASIALCGLVDVAQRTSGNPGALLEAPSLELPGFDSRS
jgi:hypothetical protein